MIVSESGRAIAAYHSVLIFDALGSSALDKFHVTGNETLDYGGSAGVPQPVLDLADAYRSVTERRLVECYHDAITAREQALQMFNLGLLSLEFRGLAERLYWATCAKIRDCCRKLERVPEELRRSRVHALATPTSATSRCSSRCRTAGPSTSCFPSCRSTAWTSGRRAPACWRTSPATPTARSTGSSPCAMSSGRSSCTSSSPGEEYYLAAFLVGAYQETLGDLHNLFGDTHVVHIRLHDEGGWWIEEIVKGDTANRVLEYMEYDVAELYPALARDCERAIRDGRMTLAESQQLKRFYEGELNGYAYLGARRRAALPSAGRASSSSLPCTAAYLLRMHGRE